MYIYWNVEVRSALLRVLVVFCFCLFPFVVVSWSWCCASGRALDQVWLHKYTAITITTTATILLWYYYLLVRVRVCTVYKVKSAMDVTGMWKLGQRWCEYW
eukprot:Lankesteria_metandrocarpae@DN5415_c2_g1_i18.p1